MTFQELYKHEMEQRERLRAAVSIPLGLLVVIGGLLGAMLQSVWFERTLLCLFFLVAAVASACFFVRTMYFLVRSYHGHIYKAMPFALEMRAYRDDIRVWHTKYGSGKPEDGEQEYNEYLDRSYAEAADHNAFINLAKSEYLFRANTSVVFCVVLTVVTFIPFTIHRFMNPAGPQKIEIVNQPAATGRHEEIRMPDEKPKPAAPQPPPQSPPPKPTPPPLRNLKEGQIPKKK